MNRLESERYIRKFDKRIIISDDWFLDRGIACAVVPSKTIHVNPRRYYRSNSIKQKAVLLHEYGHLALNHWDDYGWQEDREKGKYEYEAHILAIRISRGIVKEKLISMIKDWGKYKCDKIHMPYIKANRMYMKKGLLGG